MAAYAHLHESTLENLGLSDQERIAKIQGSRWIGYSQAQQVINRLETLLDYPKKHRMPNLLIVGPTNNGKTMIVNRFRSLHLPADNIPGEGVTIPVLDIECPPVPDESRLYNAILSRLFVPHKPHDHIDRKKDQVLHVMDRLNVRMLVLDEIHNILAGHTTKQRQMLNTLKYLGNSLQIPIVGVGIKEAFQALQIDPQLANRFEPVLLPRWDLSEDFQRLLLSFEMMLPLKKPSNLAKKETSILLMNMSEGIIGELSAILTNAAVNAIVDGSECITPTALKKLTWTKPGERKKQAHKAR